MMKTRIDMRRVFIYNIIVLAVSLLCASVSSCSLEETMLEVTYQDSVSPRSFAVNGGGDEFFINVDTQGEWEVSLKEGDREWISIDPETGSGKGSIRVTSSKNDNVGALTELEVIVSGKSYPVTLEVDELLYLRDGFDLKKAPSVFPYPEISFFAGWERHGFGASSVEYSGSAYVSSAVSSISDDRLSGQNSIYFKEVSDVFEIQSVELSTSETRTFSFEFWAMKSADGLVPESISQTDLGVSVSSNGIDYVPLSYKIMEEGSWNRCVATFSIKGCEKAHLRLQSAVASLYIDDIRLVNAREIPQDGSLEVHTGMTDNITKTSATLSGRFVYTGSGYIADRGFEYRVEDEEEFIRISAENISDGSFSAVIDGLVEGESYVVRAYVSDSEGQTIYGSDSEFVTLVDPVGKKVADVRALYDGSDKKLPAGWILTGNIVSDYGSGNFNGSSFAFEDGTDPESGIIVNIIGDDKQPATHSFRSGTPVDISLRGVRFVPGEEVRINVPLSQITANGEPEDIAPVLLSAVTDMSQYDGMLVSLENVQSAPQYVCRPWGYGVNEPAAPNRIVLESGDSDYTVEVLPDAEFRLQIVGEKRGSITGICVDAPDGPYIMPRGDFDIALTEDRDGELVEKIVYYEDFGSGPKALLQNYTDYRAEGQDPNNVTFYSDSKDGNVYTSKQPGKGYPGASEGNHAYINSEPRDIHMKGLNTSGKKSMYFTLGASYMRVSPSLESNKGNLVIKCSADQGKTWMTVPINVLQNGTADNIWAFVEVDRTFVIPESEDLWFIFTFKKNQGMMDDLRIVCYE